jgi:hypothetical protein
VEEIMRFPSAVPRDGAVDVWLDRRDERYAIAKHWFARIRECGGDVTELMHDGCPTACVEDGAFAYVNVYTAHVNVGFFHGATLNDPTGLLEGTGKRMRHVKLRPGQSVNAPALSALIEAAYLDIKTKLELRR